MTRRLIALLVGLGFAQTASAQLNPTPVAPGLWRGKAPYRPSDYAALLQLGVRTVLDLRGNQPFASALERRRVEAMGLTYRKVPFGFRPLRDASDGPVLAAMLNTADHPLYMHCNLNRDRTSVAVATFRVRAQGWNPQDAAAEARSFGLKRYFLGLNRYLRVLQE